MTAAAARSRPQRITVSPIGPVFGAEIGGIDLTRPLDDATFAEIDAAFEEYSVLVFHDQFVDDDQQIAFSARFGELESNIKSVANAGRNGQVSRISNVGPDGDLLPLDDRAMLYRKGNELWHSDSSFKRIPAKASLLSAREVPPAGGETEFASERAGWATLPPAKQAAIENLVAIHSFTYSRGLVAPGLLNPEEAQQVPPVPQRLVLTNPVNGRRSLYLGSHAQYIEGMSPEAGRALLDELMAHTTQPQFTYLHRWRRGDIVMWDNRATLHRGHGWEKARYRRVMHRTTVGGTEPTVP